MKKLIALVLVCLLGMTSALAAEWPEGLSPNKPYPNAEAVDFNKHLGYLIYWPRADWAAQRFCDVLEMYMPRDDIALGEGKVTLCDSNGVVAEMDCADPAQVELRPMEEYELQQFPYPWGCGQCLEVHLPVSLEFDKDDYYVMMDEGVLRDPANGNTNPPMNEKAKWHPLLQDEFGISKLYYTTPEAPADDDEEQTDAPKVPEGDVTYTTYHPAVGDIVVFDLVLGGDAKRAVVYSENDSVYFDVFEFDKSGTVIGTITDEDVGWGIVFLNEAGEALDMLTPKESAFVAEAEAGLEDEAETEAETGEAAETAAGN